MTKTLKKTISYIFYFWYNLFMKNETKKEFGKLIYDFSKIGFAIAFVTPLVKGESVTPMVFLPITIGIIIGTYLINKGAKNE